MLDLVKHETERIDSRFLEPACGHGNFLAAILERKLNIVAERYRKSRIEFERYGVLAIGSIYGIDLLPDNVIEARERLLEIFEKRYRGLFRNSARTEVLDAVRFVLARNIIVGDALELTTSDGKPIVFSEWSLITGDLMKRRDYSFGHLVNRIGADGPLFSDLGEDAFIAEPVTEFPPVHFLKIAEMEEHSDD